MENNEEKSLAKQNAGVIIIIVALLIAVFGLGGYIVYDKLIADDEQEEVTEKEEENKEEKETALNDNTIQNQLKNNIEFLEKIEIAPIGSAASDGYYREGEIYSKNYKTEDIKEEDKLYAVLRYSKNIFSRDYTQSEGFEIGDGEKVNKLYNSIFGENIKNYNAETRSCPSFKYDESTKKYTAIVGGCGGTSQCWIDTYNNKYTVKGDNYYVYVNFGAYCAVENGGSKAFTNYEHNKAYDGEVTINNSHFITEENHDKFSEYKYTFTKTKDGDYKFVSIEKVK